MIPMFVIGFVVHKQKFGNLEAFAHFMVLQSKTFTLSHVYSLFSFAQKQIFTFFLLPACCLVLLLNIFKNCINLTFCFHSE